MEPINVMVNGLPGRMARAVAEGIARQPERFSLVPYSLTGADIQQTADRLPGGPSVRLVPPKERPEDLGWLSDALPFVAVDFSAPQAVEGNVDFYCRQGWPFVLGTTGGDYEAVRKRVARSQVCAVAAPNMSIPILLVMAAFELLGARFPGALAGWKGEIVESHQAGKRDTSGTAKRMIEFLQQLGIPLKVEQIAKIRDPKVQREQLDVPEEHLGGHAYHIYTLRSPDGSVQLGLTHNVLGRQTYVEGTLAAIRFVAERYTRGARGRTYSMLDVLEAGGETHG